MNTFLFKQKFRQRQFSKILPKMKFNNKKTKEIISFRILLIKNDKYIYNI